jgi:RHS repeat-associated protein
MLAAFICGCATGGRADDRVISPDLGFQPAHAYAISGIESIDKATGSLSLHIPLAQLPAGPAGSSAGLTLVYNNKYWEVEPMGGTYGLTESFSGGWRLAMMPSLEVRYIASSGEKDPCGYFVSSELFQMQLTNPDGSRNTMLLSNPVRRMPTACESGTYRMSQLKNENAPSVWYTADGSFLRLEIDAPSVSGKWPGNSSWTLYRQDGSSVRYEVASKTVYLKDRNGNRIAIARTVDSLNPTHTYEVMADEFGRTIRLDHFGDSRDEVSQIGHNGTPLVWKIYYGSVGPIIPDAYICDQSALFGCSFDSVPRMATRLELPNGLSYLFGYERPAPFASNYRELRTLTLPSGARIDYEYRLDANSKPTNYYHVLANPITAKIISADGGNIEKWGFSYDMNLSTGAYSRNTHKAPDGGITSHEFNSVSYKFGLQPDSGFITKIVNPDGSIISRDWHNNLPLERPSSLMTANPWVSREYATNANASGNPVATAVKVFTIDRNGNTTSVEERGWVPYSTSPWDPSIAALMRKTVNIYLNGAGDSASGTSVDTKAYSYASLSPVSIPRNLLASAEIQDGSGAVKSRSQFSYAETNPARTAGNLTAEFHWDSTKPGYASLGSGAELTVANSLVKRYEYTARGNLKKEIDARSIATTYDYGNITACPPNSATLSDLYRTGAHQGQNGSGALLDWSFSYNCNSGKRTSSTDPNYLVTSVNYDNYGRPITIIDGNYRKTVHTYNDASLWIVTQRDVSTFNDLRNVAVLHYDRLGRIRLSRRLEAAVADPVAAAADESTGIRSDTKYDISLNHNETWVSNPYRADETNAPTRGWTVKRMDRVGRVCVEEWFAGAATPALAANCAPSSGSTGAITHKYNSLSNATVEEIADAAGRTIQMYRDVLGRLVAVREDPASAKYDTYYQYDLLDNLTASRQAGSCIVSNPVSSPCGGGQTRSFAYDSLERLSAATNPELDGNTLRYRYDENGNITSKSGSGSAALLVSFTYDALNRVKTRDYSDGKTMPVTYCYDGTSWSGSIGGCNGFPAAPSKGHLTEAGSAVSRTSYSYNTAGQITGSTQTTAGRSFSFIYAYNAGLDPASVTLPSGRKVVAEYDDAGRTNRLWSQDGASFKDYAGSARNWIRYAAHGAIQSMTLGNGIEETRSYNSRLQPTRIQAGALLTLWNCYQAGDDASCPSLIATPVNSGDIQGQKIMRSSQSWTQKFTYDAMNRLSSALETGGWRQNYGYDPFGNRWVSSASGLPANPLAPSGASAFSAATNRLTGTDNYDIRGNLKLYGAYALTYDGDDHITSASGVAPSVRYEYDAEGRRVRMHMCASLAVCAPGPEASTTIYVYDAFGKLAAEYGPASGNSGTRYFTLDHLGSTRLETDTAGQPVKCSDYLPFGEEIPAGSSGRSACFVAGDNKIKFVGKERDAVTGLDFSLARYYSGSQGRFTSDDPLNIPALQKSNPKQFASIIANPQNWNGYAYAHNNPLKKVDPDGFLTIIIAGTWNNQREWQKSFFRAQVEKTFGETAVLLSNDHMKLSVQARSAAAKQLNSIIAAHKFAPREKLNIVAHSHGGNVVAEATQKGLSHKIDTLVTMGTPIRPDYQFNELKIAAHFNVFSSKDRVQPSGGMTYDFGGSLMPGFIPASREVNLPGVINLDATSQAGGHSELWTKPGTWDKIVAPEIK